MNDPMYCLIYPDEEQFVGECRQGLVLHATLEMAVHEQNSLERALTDIPRIYKLIQV